MPLELRVTSGARAGRTQRFEKSVIALGRHPLSDLQFDPEKDLDVSTRHAEIRGVEGRWILRDEGSTNGTFVNGKRLAGEHVLRSGDVITFGANGPRVEVSVEITGELVPLTNVQPSPPRPSKPVPPTPSDPLTTTANRPATVERVAIAVREQTRWMRWTVLGLLVVLVAGLSGAFWVAKSKSDAADRAIAQATARTDSLLVRMQSQVGTAADSFVLAMRERLDSLERELRAARESGREGDVATIRSETERAQRSVSIDLAGIHQRNDDAVAFLVSEIDGKPFGGTAFSISREGLLITNRHNVRDTSGRAATRTAIKFANTENYFPVRVVRVSTTDDLALVQVEGIGPFPAVSCVARNTPGVGNPVVVIGFPLSLSTPQDGEVVKTSLMAGTVSKRVPDLLQLDSYANHGASGSPIFDARGCVTGVLWGGAREAGGRIVYAVPSDRLATFLGPQGSSLVR